MQPLCRGIAVSITDSLCVFVALGIQHARDMRHIVVRGLPRCTIFSHIISQKARLKIYLTHNGCFEFCLTYCYPQKK